MSGVVSRVRRTFERGVWPFVAFVALLVAMAGAGLSGMPILAAALGLAALADMLVIMLARSRPAEEPSTVDEPTRATDEQTGPNDMG